MDIIGLKATWPYIKEDDTREIAGLRNGWSFTEINEYMQKNYNLTYRFIELRKGLQEFQTQYWRGNCEALRQTYLPFIALRKDYEIFKNKPVLINESGIITLDQLYNLWQKSGMLSTHIGTETIIVLFGIIYRVEEIHADIMNILENFCQYTFRTADMRLAEIRETNHKYVPRTDVIPVFKRLEDKMSLWEEEDMTVIKLQGAIFRPMYSEHYQRILMSPYESIGKHGNTNFVDLVVLLPNILDGEIQLCDPNIDRIRKTFLMWETWKATVELNMETVVLKEGDPWGGGEYKLGDIIANYKSLHAHWNECTELKWCVRNYLDICWYGDIFQRMKTIWRWYID
jgi:hypothetical protein